MAGEILTAESSRFLGTVRFHLPNMLMISEIAAEFNRIAAGIPPVLRARSPGFPGCLQINGFNPKWNSILVEHGLTVGVGRMAAK